MFVAAAVISLAAVAIGAVDWRDRNPDIARYEVKAERMFEGTIASHGHILEGLMYFPLKISQTVMEVQIGPKEFVARSGFKLTPGDMVEVIGVPVIVNDREVVLAREVRSMNGVLIVRDDTGVPLWERNRPIQMDPELQTLFSKMCQMFSKY